LNCNDCPREWCCLRSSLKKEPTTTRGVFPKDSRITAKDIERLADLFTRPRLRKPFSIFDRGLYFTTPQKFTKKDLEFVELTRNGLKEIDKLFKGLFPSPFTLPILNLPKEENSMGPKTCAWCGDKIKDYNLGLKMGHGDVEICSQNCKTATDIHIKHLDFDPYNEYHNCDFCTKKDLDRDSCIYNQKLPVLRICSSLCVDPDVVEKNKKEKGGKVDLIGEKITIPEEHWEDLEEKTLLAARAETDMHTAKSTFMAKKSDCLRVKDELKELVNTTIPGLDKYDYTYNPFDQSVTVHGVKHE